MITVLGYTILIRLHPGLTMGSCLLVLSTICLVSQFIITYYASNSAKFSAIAISNQKRTSTNRLVLKSLISCKEFALKSGSFRVIDKMALIIVMAANIDYTVSLLLAFQ